MYYETIYVTGDHSIAFYEDDDEARRALSAHHERAEKGLSAVAQSEPRDDVNLPDPDFKAVRIDRVLVYEQHPADYNLGGKVLAADIGKQLADIAKSITDDEGLIDVGELSAHVAAIASPRAEKEKWNDSAYKMPEARELDWAGGK